MQVPTAGLGDEVLQTMAHAEMASPPFWLSLPFGVLLLMIATGPLLYPTIWHRYYPHVAVVLALGVMGYYVMVLGDWGHPIGAMAEYIQFMALIAALFVASSGVSIHLHCTPTPGVNLAVLWFGALMANVVGTTGASMLLIRPFIRLNGVRVKAYHVVFFIFFVSNVGGALTPIGDPPLFLGFLKGVPFFWTLQHNFLPWLMVLMVLSGVFYGVDRGHQGEGNVPPANNASRSVLTLEGGHNFIWLALIVGGVFIDPEVCTWVPAISYGTHRFSWVREVILFAVAGLSYRYANNKALAQNTFSWEPLREVAFLFVGIFGTMMPALAMIGDWAHSEAGRQWINVHTLYWGTGLLSSVLDNAPTYLNFLTASMASYGLDVHTVEEVRKFAMDDPATMMQLKSISLASVCFGAMTYIGNGPNFMVKSIAGHLGVDMPSFFAYIGRYTVVYLLPILTLLWLVFFSF